MKHRSSELDMLHGPLAGKLLRFTLTIALSSIVQQLFNDPGNASSVMVSGVDQSTVDSVTDILVQDASPTIDGIDKSMSSSVAYVTADAGEGGTISYQVQMSRDLIGWKVSDVSLYFPSQH